MYYVQAVVEAPLVAGLLSRLGRLGIEYRAAPYDYAEPGSWRFLARGALGTVSEHQVEATNAAKIDVNLWDAEGRRSSPGWAKERQWLHQPPPGRMVVNVDGNDA